MQISVIGLGKIGLPLAVQYASRGPTVIGCDINPETVAKVNRAEEPFPGEQGLSSKLLEVVRTGKLVATTTYGEAISDSDVVVVVVPLLVDDRAIPDFTALDDATEQISTNLTPGTLVCYETTLPVGTTRLRFAPALATKSGLELGKDLFVAFSPERVFSGRVFDDLRRYPKLVGADDPASSARAVAFYQRVLEFDHRIDLTRENGVWDLGSTDATEMAKLAETTYRDVNIALANQFARFADSQGFDVHAVIEAANSQPFSHIHQPGIAVGGHCIPVYPQFYLWNDPAATVVASARVANRAMPSYGVTRLAEVLGDLSGQTVAILGAAYRGGVKETAFSGVFPLVDALSSAGANAVVHDPLYTQQELIRLGLVPYSLGSRVDGVIIQTDHPEYSALSAFDVPGARAILDGRRISDPAAFVGIPHLSIGQGRLT